jgi:TetR/AcrR family transcriptional repressor of lmrAB and yxaGH operons
MVSAAGRLFRRQGYAATGWREVVREAGAPWGSQSHHFPGGKRQLAAEAIERGGRKYRELLESAVAGVHPAEMVEGWAALAAQQLAESGWVDGCPIATVALEESATSDQLARACHAALQSWVGVLAEAITGHGVEDDEAQALATLVVAGIEGALLLARAGRDTEPLRLVGHQLGTVLRARIP